MLLTPANSRKLAEGLDHPEAVCLNEAGDAFAGGECGQVYRIGPDGTYTQAATTNGFVLGLALDGDGALHVCDCRQGAVWQVEADGTVTRRTPAEGPFRPATANYPVFDAAGMLYVSDSGDFWATQERPGRILRLAPDGETTVFHKGPFAFANGLAIDPDDEWLYIVESRGPGVARIPLAAANGKIERVLDLPSRSIPDGICFAVDGTLFVACYSPDVVYRVRPGGGIEVAFEDPTGDILNRPSNIALADGRAVIANLGGWHLTEVRCDAAPRPLHLPILSRFNTKGNVA